MREIGKIEKLRSDINYENQIENLKENLWNLRKSIVLIYGVIGAQILLHYFYYRGSFLGNIQLPGSIAIVVSNQKFHYMRKKQYLGSLPERRAKNMILWPAFFSSFLVTYIILIHGLKINEI